jgi:transposase
MYIRKNSRKNKDGSEVTYLELAHNQWNSKKGRSETKVLYNFGRIEHLDIAQLKRLVKSISRFLPPEDALESQVLIENRGRRFKWEQCRSFGGIYLLSALWQWFDFKAMLEKRVADRQFTTPIVQAIFAMVANRCLAPRSKLAITEWVQRDVYISDLPHIDVQVLYRAMDFLLEHQKHLEREIYWAVADLLNVEVDLLFFDTTTTYFQTEQETELKQRGHSKDKRPDLPQVVIGLAVTRSGIPIKHWVFPGNTVDISTIEQVKKDLGAWRLNRCVIVHDCGMSSEYNLQYLQRGGGHYIVGRKMKTGEAFVEQALSQKGRYTAIEEDLWAKEVIIGNGEKRKRLLIVKNIKEQQRDQRNRLQLIETLEEKVNHLNSRHRRSHSKAVCELKSHRVYGSYIKQKKDGKLKIDRSKLRKQSRYDGKYLVETSDDTLSLRDIVLGYKQLYDIERAFRTLKTELDLHPNNHSKDERIRCHIFLCFIALVLVRIIENKTGKTWSRVHNEIARIHYGEFLIESKKVCRITELTQEQKNILDSLEIKEPNTFIDIQIDRSHSNTRNLLHHR